MKNIPKQKYNQHQTCILTNNHEKNQTRERNESEGDQREGCARCEGEK